MLLDTLAKHSTFLNLIEDPSLLRVNATRAIINALNLVLQLEIHSAQPATSLLLLDPQPDTMTSALLSAASSLAFLYDTLALSSRVVEAMLSVVTTGLGIVSQVSPTARTAVPRLKSMFLQRSLNFPVPKEGSKASRLLPADTDPSEIATMWIADFTKDVVQDYRFRCLDNICGSENHLTYDIANSAFNLFDEPIQAET